MNEKFSNQILNLSKKCLVRDTKIDEDKKRFNLNYSPHKFFKLQSDDQKQGNTYPLGIKAIKFSGSEYN